LSHAPSRISPIQALLLGFLALAAVGAVLLALPIATQPGEQPLSAIDAVFESTSALTTTGLTAFDTGRHYSLFGQVALILLVQIGGIGYMTLVAFVMTMVAGHLSFQGSGMMQASLPVPSRGEMKSFVARVIVFTVFFETVGAALLVVHWLHEMPLDDAIYYGVFHSISAFATSGYMLPPAGFAPYRDDAYFNVVINVLAISGAVGFLVLGEAEAALAMLFGRARPGARRWLSVHTRLALSSLIVLGAVGTALLLLLGLLHGTGGPSHAPPLPRSGYVALPATFQAMSAVTTSGFSTVDIGSLPTPSLAVLAALMFIGAPTGGTGGGIKSTTFAVLLLLTWAVLRGHRDVNAFGRRIETATIAESVGVLMAALIWLVPATIALTLTEGADLMSALFEATSALSTVGLTTGLASHLSLPGKVVIIATMFVGRAGPLTIALSVFRSRLERAYRHPTEHVFVG